MEATETECGGGRGGGGGGAVVRLEPHQGLASLDKPLVREHGVDLDLIAGNGDAGLLLNVCDLLQTEVGHANVECEALIH